MPYFTLDIFPFSSFLLYISDSSLRNENSPTCARDAKEWAMVVVVVVVAMSLI